MSSVIEIHPLTRVEGHGMIQLVYEGGRVARVELVLTESPRLFEALLKGKSFVEIPDIICRICSLCSTIHRVTALHAVENALGIEVSQVTRLTRELMAHAGQIQSHALHLYFLVLPDLLGVTGLTGLAKAAPETLRAGLAIKQAANLVQETAGGRLIHPINLALGRLGRPLARGELSRLKDALEEIVPECAQAVQLFAFPPPFPRLTRPDYLAARPDATWYSGSLLHGTEGAVVPVTDYRSRIVEEVVPETFAKRSLVSGKVMTVGALARVNLGTMLSPRAAEALRALEPSIVGCDIWGNVPAQVVEMIHSVDAALDIVERLWETGPQQEEPPALKPRAGAGSAACEAPRGTLIHSFAFDADGRCTAADVITPTALNHAALARDLSDLTRQMPDADKGELTAALQRLVRAYDPCISCAVHVIEC
ncbi:Ni/Fe hydrogenase subunit alpha [Geomesophilobacter sediminis]|uniref:Ni/Fe hydrogenase subunit alpha n=1 Tax=Geomesophilobacter sediminis TaxID=2798584 RepID=A0A8J7JAY3_9BACT|nr:Ni/Fe hydrogenase subunit alpha [Geomesophilobacter sediminis]MBJ6723623.1 Ni/Fe hydrogenase subunit alpha [Geomesophilobacter sediminis]